MHLGDAPWNGSIATRVPESKVALFLQQASALSADQMGELGLLFAAVIGATSARIMFADYDQRVLTCDSASVAQGDVVDVDGTVAGRAFVSGQPCVVGDGCTVWLALAEGEERLGVVELTFAEPSPAGVVTAVELLAVLVLVVVSKRRHTDWVLRARRTRPLTVAAEMQWDLLPPLSSASRAVTICGRLDPAYATGGDSLDYAFNPGVVEFALVDAVGHGLAAVLKSVAAIGALRNARREKLGLVASYQAVDAVLAAEFGHSFYVTGVLATLNTVSGELCWINAGHPLPLLVRNGHLVGELVCEASIPMGLGGVVREVASNMLQPGDKVLFYTDGVTEGRSSERVEFGADRLGELFVRASLDGLSLPETARKLSGAVRAHSGNNLADDATLLIVEFHP